MTEEVLYTKSFSVHGGDFDRAGEVSTQIKSILKGIGINSDIVRRVAIATFESEVNVVIHAEEGEVKITITPKDIVITVDDRGKGIPDIDQAMQEGFSTASDEMREMGFGAGLGLPTIRKNSDVFSIESQVGVGTKLTITIHHEE
jgi:anti-sigma regulatory factor (Ser/Thr protein kinase)